MADPIPFTPSFDYSDFEASNPTAPKPGAQLDNDFFNVEQSVRSLVDAVKDIRRSDGKLNNRIVTKDSLAPDTLALIAGNGTPRGEWTTGTAYVAKDLIEENFATYIAVVSHTAGVFADDLAAGKWLLFASPIKLGARLAKSAAYTVSSADDQQTIALGGSAFYPLTFAAASGYAADFSVKALNEDTDRGKLLLVHLTTSSTSLAIATGAKAFTIPSGLPIFPNTRYRAWSLADKTKFMSGKVASYSSTTLTLTVDTIGGAGTLTDWQIAPEVILYPRQTANVFNDDGTWILERPNTLWMPDKAPTFHVDASGSDANDGLATGSGAFKTLGRAASVAYTDVYTRNRGSIFIDGGGGTFKEFIQVFYPLSGGGVLSFQNFTWAPIDGGFSIQFGDGALVGLKDITFDAATAVSAVGYVFGHQYGVLDVNTGITIKGGISGDVFMTDGDTRFNINNGLAFGAGTIGGCIYQSGQGSVWTIGGAHTFTGNPSIGRLAWSREGSRMQFGGGFSVSGSASIGVSLCGSNGVIMNLSGASFPGGDPTPTSGGEYVTSLTG